MISKIEINAMAIELRRTLGVEEGSPIDIFGLASQIEGLSVVLYPMGENISGICIKNPNANLIAINSSMSYGRERFSLAHELYHLFYDKDSSSSVSAMHMPQRDVKEKIADEFASFFLMPYNSLRNLVKNKKGSNITDQDVIVWEQYFGISHKAMLLRLLEDGFIDERQYESFSENVIRKAKLLGFDDKLYVPTKCETTLGNYIQQVTKLNEKNMISSGKYEELLLDAFRSDIVYGEDEDYLEIND